MTIDWGAFLLVFVVSLVAAGVVVALFSTGLRLLAPDPRPRVRTAAAYGCFAACACGALYGLYLIIPAFH